VKTITKLAAAVLSLSTVLACGEDLDPGSRVTDLRVLAVRADRPFAQPGEKVTLEALAHDPLGRPISWGWAACIAPDGTDVASCIRSIGADAASGRAPLAVTGTDVTRFELTVPADALARVAPEARGAATVGVIAAACPERLVMRPDRVDCVDASGAALPPGSWVLGIKHVTIREHDRNANPTFATVTFDGAPWADDDVKTVDACDTDGNRFDRCPESLAHRIAAVPAPDAVEHGVDELGQAFDEAVVVQSYATEGIFEHDVRVASAPETRWVARAKARGGEQLMWFVVRDDRGGVSWTSRRLRVR
jgi:hypothetical protein